MVLEYLIELALVFLSNSKFQKPWCLQPLHTAWFNLLLDNPRLFEQILQYEPLELRLIRSTFKEIGLLFDNNVSIFCRNVYK